MFPYEAGGHITDKARQFLKAVGPAEPVHEVQLNALETGEGAPISVPEADPMAGRVCPAARKGSMAASHFASLSAFGAGREKVFSEAAKMLDGR